MVSECRSLIKALGLHTYFGILGVVFVFTVVVGELGEVDGGGVCMTSSGDKQADNYTPFTLLIIIIFDEYTTY